MHTQSSLTLMALGHGSAVRGASYAAVPPLTHRSRSSRSSCPHCCACYSQHSSLPRSFEHDSPHTLVYAL